MRFRDLDRSGRRAPALLVIFPGVLNLGDADARGALAGEPQQFIAGDFIAQRNQGRSIGTHGLQHLLPERRISGDVSKKLPELVRAHAAGERRFCPVCCFMPVDWFGDQVDGMTLLAVSGASAKPEGAWWRRCSLVVDRSEPSFGLLPFCPCPDPGRAGGAPGGATPGAGYTGSVRAAGLHGLGDRHGCSPSINLAGPLQVERGECRRRFRPAALWGLRVVLVSSSALAVGCILSISSA